MLNNLELVELLRSLSPFYYWANNGNLGDLLIAEATRQFFRRYGIVYREFNPDNPPANAYYNIVYGGGGRFTPHWGGLELFSRLLTAPMVRRAVILPHSISGVDSFVRSFDSRHTIIARTEETYRYCKALNREICVELADDMALQMDVSELPSSTEARRALPKGIYAGMLRRTHRATSFIPGTRKRVTFMLRTDRERCVRYTSPLAYDISLALPNSDCREHALNGAWLRAFADALSQCDVVVTDRLHVAVMAHLVGKAVMMLDNDYGKLSGVYNQTLFRYPNILLLADGTFPPDISAAWLRLNSPLRLGMHKIQCKLRRVRRKLGDLLCR